MRDGQATPPQGYQATPFQACAAGPVDRLAQTLAVMITIAEDEIAGKCRTFMDDIGNGQVAAVDQDLGSAFNEHGHRGLGAMHLVVRVREDSDTHDGWVPDRAPDCLCVAMEKDADSPLSECNAIMYQFEDTERNYHPRHWPGPAPPAKIYGRQLKSPGGDGPLRSLRAHYNFRPR